MLLDITGTILVAVSLINLNRHVQAMDTTEDLGPKGKRDLKTQSNATLAGVIMVALGFALIFGEEVASSIEWV